MPTVAEIVLTGINRRASQIQDQEWGLECEFPANIIVAGIFTKCITPPCVSVDTCVSTASPSTTGCSFNFVQYFPTEATITITQT